MKKYLKPLYIEMWADSPDEVETLAQEFVDSVSKSGDLSAYVEDGDVLAVEDEDGNDLRPTYVVQSGMDDNVQIELKSRDPNVATIEAIEALGYMLLVVPSEADDEDERDDDEDADADEAHE